MYNRYTYLADAAVTTNTVTDKEKAELWAFSAAILPLIDDCDAAVATTVRDNTDIANTVTPTMDVGWAALKADLETVYSCMGITCELIGGYIDEATGDYVTGFDPCVDTAAADGTIVDIAGYTPGSSLK